MHFVVIFIAIIWLICGGVKDKLNTAIYHNIWEENLRDAIEKYDIPPHLAKKYQYYPEFHGINCELEEKYVREIAEELGVHQSSTGVMNTRHPVSMWGIFPKPITPAKEEYNAARPWNNYDIDSQVYPRLRQRCNDEGFLTVYQAVKLEGHMRRETSKKCKERIIK